MTREQMIDEAVRRSMSPVTMKKVGRSAEQAFRYGIVGKEAECALSRFPDRVSAIRAEFRRIAGEQAHA